MANPQFSILLPTHNRADVLPFAIQSVLAQTLRDYELLIVGDGCTDHTAEVVRGFDDPRIRWFDLPKAPNTGYANRNVALRQARGELIAYMQHDDLWLPDHLELLSSCLEHRKAELAYSQLLLVSPDGIIMARVINLNDPHTLERHMAIKTGLGTTCVIHRRSCFENYGYWDERLPFAGDTELWNRIIEGGGRSNFAYLPIPTSLHFLANWHRQSWKNKLKLKVYRMEGSLPSELTIHIPPGITEQEAIWREMDRDMFKWTYQLRQAIQLELDRRASAAYPSTLLAFIDAQYKRFFN